MSTHEDRAVSPSANALLLQHYAAVRRYLGRRLNSRSVDADDLTQEVCQRFLSSYCGQPLASPVAYLLTIARNVLADFLQRRQREVLMDPATFETTVSDRSGDSPEREGSLADLVRLLSQLPRTQRAILVAHKIEGYSYVEVARRLSLSELTVQKYLTMARSHLRATRQVRQLRAPLRRQSQR